MANWISSKLRVAETFFEQIDQQAAESLKKNERNRSEEEYPVTASTQSSGVGTIPLKVQLKKKTSETGNGGIDDRGVWISDRNVTDSKDDSKAKISLQRDTRQSGNGANNVGGSVRTDSFDFSRSPAKPKPTLSDSDWTELLSTPAKNVSGRNNNASETRILKKAGSGRLSDGKKLIPGIGQKSSGNLKSKRRLDDVVVEKLNGKFLDCEEPNVEMPSFTGSSVDQKPLISDIVEGKEAVDDLSANAEQRHPHVTVSEEETNKSSQFVRGGERDYASDRGRFPKDAPNSSEFPASLPVSRISMLASLTREPTLATDESDSDTESGSSSESDVERNHEKAAAKAFEAIKMRENLVAMLEGEKLSLEKILEEEARQQVREASKLQSTMIETMEAVEIEKQKHNTTMKEALTRLAKLESANADHARCLAAMQKNLENEMKQVNVLRQQLDLKELALQDLKRNSQTSSKGANEGNTNTLKGYEVERGILEAEHSFLTEKMLALDDKARKLEEMIESTRKEMEDPSEVEIELKRRLEQMTDHLIHKQAQVEALSSEKATLSMRIETVSRLLEENQTANNAKDVESGKWVTADSNWVATVEEKLRRGRKQAAHHVDSVAVFVRRNPVARRWLMAYLVCLHLWVAYILFSRGNRKSGAGLPHGTSR